MLSNVELLNFQYNCCVTCVFETTHVGNCSLPFAVLTFSLKNNLIENSPTYNSHDLELCTLYFTVWLHKSLGFSMQQINHFKNGKIKQKYIDWSQGLVLLWLCANHWTTLQILALFYKFTKGNTQKLTW
jgi:hypothetical protein